MRPYFAYGSNLDIDQMASRCPDSVIESAGEVHGWKFMINSRGVATIVADSSSVVHGLVWSISETDEDRLDVCERGAEEFYSKSIIGVQHGDTIQVEALVYLAANTAPGLPKHGYLEQILAAARSHGLPVEYLDELNSWSKKVD